MPDTYLEQQGTLDGAEPSGRGAEPSGRGARGKQPMRTSSVPNRGTSIPAAEPTAQPSQPLPPARRRSERRVAPRSERARISDLENRVEQLIGLFEHRQQTNREPISQTRRSPAPVDSPQPHVNSRARGEGGMQEEELGTYARDLHRHNREKSGPSRVFLRPPPDESRRNLVQNRLSPVHRRPGDERGSSRIRSVSDAFSSPNDGLDFSNLRASLNTRRRARGEQERADSRDERRKQAELEEERAFVRAKERQKIRAEERQRIRAEEKQKLEAEKRKAEAEERQRVEIEKRRLEDEADMRIRNQLQYQAPVGCQLPHPQLYAYTPGPGQATSPFGVEIRRAELPKDFKIPNVGRYEGRTDPAEHLGAYKVWMEFEAAEDAIKCRAFPLTLGGVARTWFTSLRSGSINSFSQLESTFMAQFIGARPVKKPPSYLSSVVQGENESLKAYVQRFTDMMMQIEGCTDDRAMQAMQDGMHDEDLIRSIAKNPPRTFSEMLVEAHKHISADEIIQSRRNLNREGGSGRTDFKKGQRSLPQGNKRNYEELNQGPRRPKNKFERFTPLNMTRSEVLMQIEGSNLLKEPFPVQTPFKFRNKRKVCRYHRDYGHTTEECLELKNEIEALIRRGHLKEFLGKATEPRTPASPGQEDASR